MTTRRPALSARQSILALLTALLPALSAHAQDISPGLWDITLDTRVDAAPGFAPGPMRLSQCVTAADARDPGKLLTGLNNPGASNCTYTERSYSGSSLRFAMQCSGTYALSSRGEVRFSGSDFSGDFTSTANIGGQSTEFRSRVSGKRQSGC